MSDGIDVHVTKDQLGYAVWTGKRKPVQAKVDGEGLLAGQWDVPGDDRCWEPSPAVALRLVGRMKNGTIKRFRLSAKEIKS